MINYYFEVLRKYAVFSGRARRAEYWYFVLFNFLITIVLSFIEGSFRSAESMGAGPLNSIYSLAVFIPSIAVGIRRMHDVDKSGWFLLIPIYNLILTLTEGTIGPNRYGQDPKSRGPEINTGATGYNTGPVQGQEPPVSPPNQPL